MSNTDETIDGSQSSRNPLEILAAEFSAARRNGGDPSIEEFIQRVPDQREQARALLQSIALLERVSENEYTRHVSERRLPRVVAKQFEQLGDYRIIREIGRGGMGIIYEAEQLTLKRRVALKVLSVGSSESAKQLERFQREAEAIARLHHTNIVPVFGSGSQDGVHYFAMQLIDGQPLSQPPTLSFQEIARLGMQAASGLAYAHSHGVLHRDIKPSNLLLDKSGEVWVTDFGLAKLSDVGELTQTGDVMGTLKYMAPEQLEGRADERTDVYSLGLTLYELVARRPAFELSKSLASRIRHHEFPAPRTVNADVPRDLETIILKATAAEPRHRYASASDMADDLRCFLEDRPIAARRVSAVERLGRWTRRNPALATSLVATLLLLMITSVVTSVGFVTTRTALQDTKKARDAAFLASQQADDARRQAVNNLEQAEQNQQRAENNLSVAMQAFDAIFDNVAQRGVPQSVQWELHEAANDAIDNGELVAGEGSAATQSNATGIGNSQQPRPAPKFEGTLSNADAELLNNLLKFYGQFASENGNDVALRARTALAYQRIGQIQQRLGNANAALESYSQALELLQLLHRQHPTDQAFILSIARIHNDRGFALSTISQTVPVIVNEHKQAIAFLESQPADIQSSPGVRFELARGFDLAGSILGRSGVTSMDEMFGPPPGGFLGGWRRFGLMPEGPRNPRPEGFGPNGPRQDGPRQDGPRQDGPRPGGFRPGGPGAVGPMNPPNGFRPAGPPPADFPPDGFRPNENRAGDRPLDRPTGDRPDGDRPPPNNRGGPRMNPQNAIDQDLFKARNLLKGLCVEFPDRNDYLLSYAQTQRHVMMHMMTTGRMPEAIEAFEQARESLDTLLERSPRDPNVLLELADTLSTASARLTSLDAGASEDYLRQAIATCQQLCESFSSVPEYQVLLANSHDKLGTLQQKKENWQAADAAFSEATNRLLELLERFPEQRFYQLSSLQSATHLAQLRLQPEASLDDPARLVDARSQLEKAIAAYQKTFVMEPLLRGNLQRANRVLEQLKARQ